MQSDAPLEFPGWTIGLFLRFWPTAKCNVAALPADPKTVSEAAVRCIVAEEPFKRKQLAFQSIALLSLYMLEYASSAN